MKHNKNRKHPYTVIICLALLLSVSGCGSSEDRVINWEDIAGAESGTGDAVTGVAGTSESDSPEELRELCERIKSFDFTIRECPINTEIYDSEMDRKYKEAFLELIFDRGDLSDKTTDSGYTFADDMLMGVWSGENYLNVMVNEAKYWYLDADGDGMPELIIDTSVSDYVKTLRVLKYDTDKGCAYLFFRGGTNSWCFMCSGDLYYRNPTGDGTRYGLCRYDLQGNLILAIDFQRLSQAVWKTQEYHAFYYKNYGDSGISLSNYVSKEVWDELTKGFFDATDHIPPSVAFDEIFGDMAVSYIP